MKSKKLISSVLVISMLLPMAACAPKKTETPQLEGYNLLWSDEFDGKEMDKSKYIHLQHIHSKLNP